MSWSTSELRVRLAPLNRFKPSSKIFYWPFQGGTSFVDLLCFCSVLCLLCLCASVYMCFVVTCWERADLLALVCGVFCEFVTFPLVSWVRCGTWLYRFLIFAPLLTSTRLMTIIFEMAIKKMSKWSGFFILWKNSRNLVLKDQKGCPTYCMAKLVSVLSYNINHIRWCSALIIIIEPWHGISNNVVRATSKASDQHAHTCSLIRAFTSRLNIPWLLSHLPNILLEFFVSKGGCTGSSESTLVKMPHCCTCHGSIIFVFILGCASVLTYNQLGYFRDYSVVFIL